MPAQGGGITVMKEKQKENQVSLAPQEKRGNNMNKLRQYWFGLDLGCKCTDCAIK